jgi:hypothetical protein
VRVQSGDARDHADTKEKLATRGSELPGVKQTARNLRLEASPDLPFTRLAGRINDLPGRVRGSARVRVGMGMPDEHVAKLDPELQPKPTVRAEGLVLHQHDIFVRPTKAAEVGAVQQVVANVRWGGFDTRPRAPSELQFQGKLDHTVRVRGSGGAEVHWIPRVG